MPDLAYTVAPVYAPVAWLKGGERFPRGAQVIIHAADERRELLNSFSASADANVSFDGTQILFAGKRQATDHWQIWEASRTGGNLRQVTSCPEDCIRPLYLPDNRFVYAKKVQKRFVIEAAPLHGGPTLALTYAQGNSLPTDVLRDGRILFEAGYPLGTNTAPEVYTVYSDGSGVESYRCDHGGGRHSGRQIGSADIVFAHTEGLARFTSALAREVSVPASAGEYAGDVLETASGEWLVSRRPSSHTSPQGEQNPGAAPGSRRHFELVRWTPGDSAVSVMVSDRNANVVQPVLLAPRPVPNRHPSALHEWDYANLLCLNAYTSKYHFADSSIATVRLYTQDAAGAARLLGSAEVEKDGSFYLRTPADQPLKVELLDANGKTLKKEAGWFWLRRGEQRICVGCHAGPETAPENAVPLVLQRSTIAADMTGSTTQTAHGGH